MNIQYIKSNVSNVSQDNLIRFLYDIILQNINNVQNYELYKRYAKGDRVYLEENGKHQIFQCIVNSSSLTFKKEEWEYIMEVFEDTVEEVYSLKVHEEVHIIDENTRNSITTNLDFNADRSSVAIFKGKNRYTSKYDFTVKGKEILFNTPFEIGDRLILEVREVLGVTSIIGIVLYDLTSKPYRVSISNTGTLSINKISDVTSHDVKYAELVTGEHTYTLLVNSSSEPLQLGLYKDINMFVTGTDDVIYKLEVNGNDLNMIPQNDRAAYSDIKVIMGSDRRFYTLSLINNRIVATEVLDDTLKPKDFDLGIKLISNEFKNKIIDINNGDIIIKDYIANEGYHNIVFNDKITGNKIRLTINEDLELELYDNKNSQGLSSTYPLDYFYFFDEEWNYYRMFVENGDLLFENCDNMVIPDSRGIKLLTPSGETAKIYLPNANNDMSINKLINLSKTGSFESPIEGFVVMDGNVKKMVTVNRESNRFEVISTNEPFRTNHHYLMSKDNRLYKLNVKGDQVSFIEQDIDNFEIECITIGAFIKSKEMISRVDIENGNVVIKPISTFMHRLIADDGTSYILDVEGKPHEEILSFRKIEDDDFSNSVGIGYLRLQDESGIYYDVNIDNLGNLHFNEAENIVDVNYEITSLIYSTQGWYRIYVEDYQIRLEKIFDNMYDNRMSYGNLVKKDLVLTSENNTDYSLYANGNGELNISKVKPISVHGLVLRSDNGYVYGLGLINDRLVSYESYITNPSAPTKICLKDAENGSIQALIMTGDILSSETVASTTPSKDKVKIYDVYRNAKWLYIKNNRIVIEDIIETSNDTTEETNSLNQAILNALNSTKKGV